MLKKDGATVPAALGLPTRFVQHRQVPHPGSLEACSASGGAEPWKLKKRKIKKRKKENKRIFVSANWKWILLD
jgi:hypothetical protein